jgi:hypothetical protein
MIDQLVTIIVEILVLIFMYFYTYISIKGFVILLFKVGIISFSEVNSDRSAA